MLNVVMGLHVGDGGSSAGRGGGMAAVAVTAAIVGQLVVLVPFTVASGLLAPLWAIALLYAVWVAAALALIPVARRRPLAAPLVPVANAVLLVAILAAGAAWLGWTP